MFLKDGRPALFDPAPLYGDREFDLGITILKTYNYRPINHRVKETVCYYDFLIH
jgi:fructosamine-3-kinase